jgi:hypothetical protein
LGIFHRDHGTGHGLNGVLGHGNTTGFFGGGWGQGHGGYPGKGQKQKSRQGELTALGGNAGKAVKNLKGMKSLCRRAR